MPLPNAELLVGLRVGNRGPITLSRRLLVALPLIHRRGQAQPGQALLLQNYQLNLAILLGVIAGVTAIAYVTRVIRDSSTSPLRRSASSSAEDVIPTD